MILNTIITNAVKQNISMYLIQLLMYEESSLYRSYVLKLNIRIYQTLQQFNENIYRKKFYKLTYYSIMHHS